MQGWFCSKKHAEKDAEFLDGLPKKNSGKEEEDNDCKEFNLEGNYESQNDPFEEDKVNGHEGGDIDRILSDDKIVYDE